MLVISRRIGESFLIGDDIEVTVLDISGEKVMLGVSAPREVPIMRLEMSETAAQNLLAGKTGNINMRGFARLYKSKLSQQRKTMQD